MLSRAKFKFQINVYTKNVSNAYSQKCVKSTFIIAI